MSDGYQIKSQEAVYFLTFQVVGWVDIFSRKECRDILIDSLSYCRNNKGMELFAYVIMTNHVHLIIKSKDANLSGLVRDLKKHTSKQMIEFVNNNPKESRKEWMDYIFKFYAKHNKRVSEYQLWTHENHAIEMDSNEKLLSRINYIHENPVRAGWVVNPQDYLYSSARNFAELDNLLQIDEI